VCFGSLVAAPPLPSSAPPALSSLRRHLARRVDDVAAPVATSPAFCFCNP
jgi:hypothetical protein